MINRLKKSKPDIAGPANAGRSRTQSSPQVALHPTLDQSNNTTNLVTPSASALVRSLDEGEQGSNTMKMALTSSSTPSLTRFSSSTPEILHNSTSNPFIRYAPRSRAEQYWAARALTAETLLVARKEHYEDVKSVTYVAETKRGNEVAQLSKLYDTRLMRLERLLVILLGFILIITFSMLFSQLSLVHSPPSGRQAQWAHFTIPILSPFASVVEHEVSVIGSKTITAIFLIIACLAYLLFRHWISRQSRNQPRAG
ncbi:hypothetical protein BT96DRAFT_987406 [Gymnopus androsaceus JB14]|uniref:Uncharacterized protein n=1 Tax=Gymnopus androsaceus JB14 TaxID=1447944 RepID=A0A6A4IBU6_9AGAR|nr:hypothetical protein BT96DRAFT_987406 [Gymnopus androsaceus JB14]